MSELNQSLGNGTHVKELLDSAKSILVFVSDNVTYDQLAAAASLYLGLAQVDKQVQIMSPSKKEIVRKSQEGGELSTLHLTGVSDIKTELGSKNLVIEFDYKEHSVGKVEYHIGEETNKFFLTVKPENGYPPIDSSTVQLAYTGADADLIFTIGVSKLEELGSLYYGFEQLFSDTSVVSIHSFQTSFATVWLNTSTDVCVSSAMYSYCTEWEVPIGGDAATNLLSSIEMKTNGFSSMTMKAEHFETIASLLRLGARRVRL